MKDNIESFYALVRNENQKELRKLWYEAGIFSWDENTRPVVLTQDVSAILQRYLNGALSDAEVEEWAEYLEAARYEIGRIGDDAVIDIVEALANQRLNGRLTREHALELLDRLRSL